MASDEIINDLKNILNDDTNLLIIGLVGGGVVLGVIALICLCKCFSKSPTERAWDEYTKDANEGLEVPDPETYRVGLDT